MITFLALIAAYLMGAASVVAWGLLIEARTDRIISRRR